MNAHTFAMICNYRGHDGTSLRDMVRSYYEARGFNHPEALVAEYFDSIFQKFCTVAPVAPDKETKSP